MLEIPCTCVKYVYNQICTGSMVTYTCNYMFQILGHSTHRINKLANGGGTLFLHAK